MKPRLPITIIRFLILLIMLTSQLSPGLSPARASSCETSGLPRVQTDKHEYDPGETVHVTGGGFDCDIPLTLRVNWPPETGQQFSATVTPDARGEFVYDYVLGATASSGAYTVEVLDANGQLLASTVFYDSHFRSGQITWSRVENLSNGKVRVQISITLSFRRSYPFDCQNANIGATCTFGLDGQLSFGDGVSVRPSYTVIGIDATNDWLLGNATLLHDYDPGLYTAFNASCCRISPPRHINNPDANWRVTSVLDLRGTKKGSPVSLLPPIVDCPRDAECRFQIIAADPDTAQGEIALPFPPGRELRCDPGDLCLINFRFATSAEWGATFQPGPLPGSPGIHSATITPTACTGQACGIFSWNTTGARRNTSGDTFYSTQIIIEELDPSSTATNRVVVDSTAVDFLIRIVNGPASGDANLMIRVPVRACGVEGAPSLELPDGPGLVGETSANGVLRRRISRVSSIYRPQTQITFFGGTTGSLPDFPIIADPDPDLTPGGNIRNTIENAAEWISAIHNCRTQWSAAPRVTGMTMVHLNDFSAVTSGFRVAGVGLIPTENNLTSQTLLGVATVMDNSYTLQSEVYGDSIGNDDGSCELLLGEACQDAPETPGDTIEILNGTNTTGNLDGVCDSGEPCRAIGDDDGICEVGEACAIELATGSLGDGDGICDIGENCEKGDPFDSILAHELGHGLTLWHGNGFDNDGQFLDGRDLLPAGVNKDGIPDGDETRGSGLGAKPGFEPSDGPNLMQYAQRGTILTTYQRERLRTQVLGSIPDRQVVTPIPRPPFANMRVDALGDAPSGEPFMDIDAMAATVDQNSNTTGLGITVAGLLPDDISGLFYTFLVDSDNNPATGGDPATLPGLAGTSLQGIEWLGRVEVAMVDGTPQATPTLFVFDGTQFSGVADPSIAARVERPKVEGLPLRQEGPPVELPAILDSIQLQLANQVRGTLADDFALYVLAQNTNTGTQDEAEAPITFQPPQFASCTANPATAFVGSNVTVQAAGFLPNSTLETFVGLLPAGSGNANALGSATLNVSVPLDAAAGLNAVSVEDTGSGMTAVCALQLEAAPEFISPPTPPSGSILQIAPGQPFTLAIRASDRDFKDTVRLSMIGEPLTLGATFTSSAGNPALGTFTWTPPESLEGSSFVLGVTATDQKGIAGAPLTIVIEITGNADTTPPVLALPPSVTLEATSSAGAEYTYEVTASDDTDPAPVVACDPASGSTFALGETTVTCTATDAAANQSTGSFTVTVVDSTAPTLAVSATPNRLWPPNHKLVLVHVTPFVTDTVDPAPVIQLVSVTSDEPDDAPGGGDGNTTGDIVIVDDFNIRLRAERAGSSDGRIYTLTYQVTDASGNITTAIVTVTVPHDQGH